MIRIALDMDDIGTRILGAVAHAVDENAAGDGTIGAGVAGLGGRRQLERPNRSRKRLTGITKSQSTKAGSSQSRPREFYETSASQVHDHAPVTMDAAIQRANSARYENNSRPWRDKDYFD
jgi:hypothetical protein